MTEITVEIPQDFRDQVQDCLSHLYDYAFLQDHSIVHALTPDVAPSQRVQVFRQRVIDAIENFSPGTKVEFHSRQSRTYNILLLRYIEGHDPQDVLQQMAFSERQFYREHRRAIEALAHVLWESLPQQPPIEDSEDGSSAVKNISVQSEIQRAFSHAETAASDLKTFIAGICAAIRSLADQSGVRIETEMENSTAALDADLVTLRQAMIVIVARLIPYATVQGVLELGADIYPDEVQIGVTTFASADDVQSIQEMFAHQESLQYLLEALEGTLRYSHDSDGMLQVALTIPHKQHTILVVDDNPDVVDLFKRYLVGQSYQIRAATEAQQAIQLARDEQPELVVLDIMLPGKDGWELLQTFKNHPATKHIPVLICSVLDVPDIAFSLGGDGYLRKPPGRSEFLTALSRWQK